MKLSLSALTLLAIVPAALFTSHSADREIKEAAKASYNYRTVLQNHVKVSAHDGTVTLTGKIHPFPMARIIFLALLIGGLALIAYAVNASESIGSDFSRFFNGVPTDRTMWFLFGGIAAAALGLSGMPRGIRTS